MRYEWIDKHNRASQELKKRLTTTSVLAIPRNGERFFIYSDALHQGLGCVLMQDGNFIAYRSRKLKVHKKNYRTYDWELITIVFALRIWRHYLYGEKFNLFSEHKSLRYLFSRMELNMRQCRYLFSRSRCFELETSCCN